MDNTFYQAARQGAAVLKQNWFGGIVRLTGPDRVPWLQGMVTNDVEKLHSGEGVYAAHLNALGKLMGQMTILVDDDAVWLTAETSNVTKLAGALNPMIIMEEVTMEDQTPQFESIGMLGPSGRSVLESWIGEPLKLEKLYDHRRLSEDCPHIVRDELGFTLWVLAGRADAILGQLAGLGAVPVDESTWNTVRIENGIPIYGIDIDETTSLPELGEKGISYDKGCYIGQEVVARVKYIGHVNRRFVGFICEGDRSPEPKGKVKLNGKDVGYVTSSAISVTLKKPIALGFVSRLAAAAGTQVELQSGEIETTATISDLPILR